MKKITKILILLAVVTVIGFYFTCFQVRETEFALVTRFGNPVRQYVDRPGFHFHWPMPIEQVIKFDSRMKVFEPVELTETTTKGAVPIIVNTYVVWRIAEPLQFFKAVGTVEQAKRKLAAQINDTQNKIIGLHEFGEIVNNDPRKIKFKEIQQEMLNDISGPVKENYGIKIETIGIKQLKISEDTSKDVFARMTAERNRKSAALESQGQAEALKITSQAQAKKTEILAAADAEAKTIKGQGAAEAAKYLEMLKDDTQFGIYLQDLEALDEILKERSTVVFSADTEPFTLLKKVPDLKPEKHSD